MTSKTIDQLEADRKALAARQRSLTARIKAARQKAQEEQTARVVATKVDLADWLIGQLCGDPDDELLDARVEALREVFSSPDVSGGLRQMVRAVTHDPLDNLWTEDERSESDGEHHAA